MPAPPGTTPDIPFRVRRSRYHQLPVYSDYKNGRSRVLTKISKIDGDIEVRKKQNFLSKNFCDSNFILDDGEDAARSLAD